MPTSELETIKKSQLVLELLGPGLELCPVREILEYYPTDPAVSIAAVLQRGQVYLIESLVGDYLQSDEGLTDVNSVIIRLGDLAVERRVAEVDEEQDIVGIPGAVISVIDHDSAHHANYLTARLQEFDQIVDRYPEGQRMLLPDHEVVEVLDRAIKHLEDDGTI
jgi:hypothetical protein